MTDKVDRAEVEAALAPEQARGRALALAMSHAKELDAQYEAGTLQPIGPTFTAIALYRALTATQAQLAEARAALMGEPYDALVNAGKKLLMHDVTASRRCHFAATRLEELAALEART